MLQRPRHSIDGDEVHIWHLFADRLTESHLREALQMRLSSQECERMQCLRHERDRIMYLLSRAMMRTVLASYLDCECSEIRFTADAHGKPIMDEPRLRFNLTHSRGAVALAVSREREVGIDVEERQRRVDHLALAERFFAEPEARHLRELPVSQLGEAFFAIWTLKEAFVKGIGRGLSFPLDAFCFELDALRLVAFRPLQDFVSPDWHFHQFDLGERHCGALAVQGGAVNVEMRDWRAAFV